MCRTRTSVSPAADSADGGQKMVSSELRSYGMTESSSSAKSIIPGVQ